jgi:hypothetical protein
MQDYAQHDQLDYLSKNYGPDFYRITFQYVPSSKDAAASLSFHLTAAEKRDIANAVYNPINQEAFQNLKKIINK